jgi:hypothetical protein
MKDQLTEKQKSLVDKLLSLQANITLRGETPTKLKRLNKLLEKLGLTMDNIYT